MIFFRSFLLFLILFAYSITHHSSLIMADEEAKTVHEISAIDLIEIPTSFYESSNAILRELGIFDLLNPYQNSALIDQNEYYWIISEPYQEIVSKVRKSEKIEHLTRAEALERLGVSSEEELRETIPLELVEVYYIGLDDVAKSGDDEHFKSLMIMPNQTFAVRLYLEDGRMCLIQSVSDGAIHGILFDGSDENAKPVKGSIIRSDHGIFNYVYDVVTGQPSFHKKQA